MTKGTFNKGKFMSIFRKLLEPLSKTINKELEKHASKNASKEATKDTSKNLAKPSVKSDIMPSQNPHARGQIHKEQRGIYNVTYNNKIATYIKTDLDSIENALRYARGDKSKGANHIKLRHHTDPKQEGYITQQELLNMGKNIREYLAKHKTPFIDEKGARLYEWENEAGERFRIVVDNIKASGSGTTPQLPRPPADDIITFYSDRNAKNKMEFKTLC